MIRSDGTDVFLHEEQIRHRVQAFPREIVRIETVIVTEQRTFTAEVRREELRVTRTAISDAGLDTPPVVTQARLPIVLVLREERLIITKAIVPIERITVDIANITGAERVNDVVRQEQVKLTFDAQKTADSGAVPEVRTD